MEYELRQRVGRPVKPLILGARYGNLTVVSRAPDNPDGKQRGEWICQCDCGSVVYLLGIALVHHGKVSCGCLKKEMKEKKIHLKNDIMSGMKYGRLTVLHAATSNPKNNLSGLWSCLCDCGSTCEVPGRGLRTGNTRSCGCLLLDVIRQRNKDHRRISPEIEQQLGKITDIEIARQAGVSRERVRQWRVARSIPRLPRKIRSQKNPG